MTRIHSEILRPTTLAATLLAFATSNASAAGPARVASYDRTLWPETIESPQHFDRASRQEILALVRVIARTPLGDETSIQSFTGVTAPNSAAVSQWLAETRRRLLANYKAASSDCGETDVCPPPADWQALEQRAHAQAATATPPAWRQAAEAFHTAYLYEQVRLAALFPRITSEIARLAPQELTGTELPDRHFALSFDDGPSRNDESERLLSWLQSNGDSALFFVLGENLERRLGHQSAAALREMYKGQCLASHGYHHAPHPKLADWQDSLDRTAGLIVRVQPDTPTGGVWFRPPYGQRTLEQTHYVSTRDGRMVLWNIDSQDWNAKLPAAAMQDRVVTLMLLWRRGILLFHDVHPKARQTLPALKHFMDNSGLSLSDCRELVAIPLTASATAD
ncbi:polysaccharide deacetylase family protein [Pseudomonas sp. GCM10022188]|uniref:polysaccharide deacetylase family protein n=1 Tax=Pseudomonas TaxID=286 RepID=UPI001E469A19|nr:polysaccharide deacetylase family protein [Pseudomonas oryzagri]MCC6075601.1 polysaccharide deacetylase family protein [Pseudomonas oryzagri]